MASKVLPQALFAIPSNHSLQCPPLKKQLGFPFESNRRFSLSYSRGNLTVSRDSSNLFSSNFSSIFSSPARNSFVVRSEAEGSSDASAESEAAILNKRAVEASDELRPVPDIRTGDIVQIKLEVPENKRRLSVYKGIVISRQNAGIHTTIRTRRIVAGIGVEIVFPLYSPNIKEIKVVAHRKVRKARLYYLRDKLPRLSTFK
uniref:Uncharacterized protein n=1 Tax=Chenopodium quinoa TaxID=63459 RepID=A0A803L5L3_CHEQI